MSLEIGPTPPPRPPGTPAARPTSASFEATLAASASAPVTRPAPVDRVQLGFPPVPPPHVLDEVGAAADRAAGLATENRELHFMRDEKSGRVVVQVRELHTGKVIRTIPPSGALAAMAGERY